MTEHPDTVSDDEPALDSPRGGTLERRDESTDAGRGATTRRDRR